MTITSPLRYPGGKAKLYDYFVELIRTNAIVGCSYVEPYAGGGGLAIRLLTNGFVSAITLNDLDPCIYSFWKCITEAPDDLCSLVERTPISIESWHQQKSIWLEKNTQDFVTLGFATYFLNRTNRSGIIDGAGPIGGFAQSGKWKLDARLNKSVQISNIQSLARHRDQIEVTNQDACQIIRSRLRKATSLMYLDPPYYVKGKKLYRNFYQHKDHELIRDIIDNKRDYLWVLSYDDTPQIREIYKDFPATTYRLNYSAGPTSRGQEVIYCSDRIKLPTFAGFRSAA